MQAPSAVQAGQPFDVRVLLDSSTYPSPGQGGSFSTLLFGLSVPSGVEVLEHGLGEAIPVSGGMLCEIHDSGDRLSFVYHGTELPGGFSLEVMRLSCRKPQAGDVCFEVVTPGGESPHAGALVTSGRALELHTRSVCVEVTVDPPLPPQAGPPFPEPTAAELVTLWLGETVLDPELGPEAGGGEPAGPTDEFCELPPTLVSFGAYSDLIASADQVWDVETSPSPDPPPTPHPVGLIEAAFTSAKASPGVQVIRVGPGFYEGKLDLDVSGMVASTVYVTSQHGPENTHIVSPTPVPTTVRVWIHGSVLPGKRLVFGYNEADDFDIVSPVVSGKDRGWHGFTITDGAREAGFDTNGAGVYVDTDAEIEIRGNYVMGNGGGATPRPLEGGGIYVEQCGELLLILHNDISTNEVEDKGAGLAVARGVGSLLKIVANYIRENVAEVRGGGLFAPRGVELCRNLIEYNRATDGCGAFLQPNRGEALTFFIEDNYVHHNHPVADQINGKGGGLAIEPLTPSFGWGYQIALNRNRIYRNGKIDPDDEANESVVLEGGGLYIELTTTSGGPLAPYGFSGHLFTNNAIYMNHASLRGGGLYYGVNAAGANSVAGYWNTVWANTLHDVVFGEGPGLYMPAFTGDGLVINSWILRENVLDDDSPSQPIPLNWFVETPSGFDPVDFLYVCTTNDDSSSPLDLFAGNMTLLNQEPEFQAVPSGAFELMCRQRDDSPTVEAGDPNLTAVTGGINHLQRDFKLVPREQDGDGDMVAVIDMGADEFNEPPGFVRGDSNVDDSFDVADVIFTLNYLFQTGPPGTCQKAHDSNDDGAVDISDSIFSLNALFVFGSPDPLPPYPGCGSDPTMDPLSCLDYPFCP